MGQKAECRHPTTFVDDNFKVIASGNADGSKIASHDFSSYGDLAGTGASRDFDADGDVDTDDLALMEGCFTGPDVPVDAQTHTECLAKDLDKDHDVDGTDYAHFQPCMSGPNNPPPIGCTAGGPPPAGTFALHGRPVDVFTDPDGGRHALLYVRARHYDLTNGRWLQRDPKGYVDGSNLYEAFGGNPLANRDPFGTDSITEENGYLVYRSGGHHWYTAKGKDTGFEWSFARLIDPNTVEIRHPDWVVAIRMTKAQAMRDFDTWPWDDDFTSPDQIMERALCLVAATVKGDTSIQILHLEKPGAQWGSLGTLPGFQQAGLKHFEHLHHRPQAVQGVARVTATSYTTVTGLLAAPTGVGGMAVEAGSTSADVATGRIEFRDGVPILVVTGAAILLHSRAGVVDDTIGGTGRAAGREAAEETRRIPTLIVDHAKYPELADNIWHAQKAGHPVVLTHGGDKIRNRAAALSETPKIPPLSRDEYPFASSLEGGSGSWVGHVPERQQSAQGAIMVNFAKEHSLRPGDAYRVKVINHPQGE